MGATTTGTNNQQRTDFEREIIFLRDNKYESGDFTNDTYDAVTLEAGTVVVVHDITHQKRAEEEKERRLANLKSFPVRNLNTTD